MANRMGLVGAAACAALALSGWVRADDSKATAIAEANLKLSNPAYLDEQQAAGDAPLMALLTKAGIGNALKNAGINVGGYVEGSYTYSASSPPGNLITGRVFDMEHEDLTLNQIDVWMEKKVDGSKFDIGGRMEWIYGADARFIHSRGLFDYYDASPDNQWDLNQLFVDVGLGGGWKIRAGKMVTPVGFETIDPTQNTLYSHSFMFNYAIPFTHTGVWAYHTVNADLNYMFGISRGWDTSLEDDNGTIDFMGSVNWNMDAKQSWALNLITGADQPGDNDNWRTIVNLIYKNQLSKDVLVGVDGVFAYEANSHTSVSGSDAMWWGVAGYLQAGINDYVAINGRVEYFNDQDGARLTGAVGGAAVCEATLGLKITPMPTSTWGKGLTIRPEVRFDYCDKPFFDGGTDRYQLTAAIDAYYAF